MLSVMVCTASSSAKSTSKRLERKITRLLENHLQCCHSLNSTASNNCDPPFSFQRCARSTWDWEKSFATTYRDPLAKKLDHFFPLVPLLAVLFGVLWPVNFPFPPFLEKCALSRFPFPFPFLFPSRSFSFSVFLSWSSL